MIANTKGLTGHAMATGIEDVLAVKALETGLVPPVANFKEVDPELGVAELVERRGLSDSICVASGRRLRFADQHDSVALGADQGWPASQPEDLGYAYRILDKSAWEAWLSRMAGRPVADLEVVHRTLRVRDQGLAAQIAATNAELRPQAAKTTPMPPAPVAVAPSVFAAKSPAPVAALTQGPTLMAKTVLAKTEVSVAAVSTLALKPTSAAPKSNEGADSVKERLLALVVEKTGYPQDMLDLDLDLEADLGVDTVKQAELFAAIREIYGIPRDENRKLRDYPTLAHVIRFVYENRPDLSPRAKPATAASTAPAVMPEVQPSAPATAASGAGAAVDDVKERLLALVVEKTGYPQDMLDLDLDLEADLGVDTVKQAELFAAIREIYGIPRDENRKLRDYPTLAQ